MRKEISILVFLIVSMTSLANTWTDPDTGITWTYTVSNGKASVGGGTPGSPAVPRTTTGDITIPSKFKGYAVTSIGRCAFYYCSGLKSVTIPNSVTSIGEGAFYRCSGLTSVTMPNSVTSIGNEAFYCCSGLASVTIPNSVTSIGDSAFYECRELTSVAIPNSVTSIRASTFYCCSGLTSVTVPSSVTSVGAYAFLGCSGLTTISIPSSVTSIGAYAFSGCRGLTRVTIQEGVTSIGAYMFCGCSGLTSVTIPSSVTSIGDYAFYGCTGLMLFDVDTRNQNYKSINGLLLSKDGKTLIFGINGDVSIPEGVTNIGPRAFSGCSGLTSVVIPSSVASIGYESFYGCSGLRQFIVDTNSSNYKSVNGLLLTKDGMTLVAGVGGDVTIPDGVTSIGRGAFYKCSGLTSVMIPNSVTSIGVGAFEYCGGLTSVPMLEGVMTIGDYAFYSCSGLTRVVVPSSVTNVGAYAFKDCTGLVNATILEGAASIGDYAFSGCSGLTDIIIPSSVKVIGDGAFSGCDNIKNVTVPGKKCGIDFSTVTNLTISEGVTCIYSNTESFMNCSALISVNIPSSVTNIMSSAFSGCSALKEFVVAKDNAYYTMENGLVLSKDRKILVAGVNGDVVIPEGVKSVGLSAFYGRKMLTSVTIPSSVTSIDVCAFDGCCGLTNVTIPEGVTRINYCAFCDCSELTSAVMPNSVEYIGLKAFGGCEKLSRLVVPEQCEVADDAIPDGCVLARRVSALVYAVEGTSAVYDGTAKVPNWTIEGPTGCIYVGDGAVDVGDYEFEFRADDFRCRNDSYEVEFCSGSNDFARVMVCRREVMLNALTNSKVYDGTPLTAGVEIGGMGFVDGECEVSATGSQTCVGSSENGVQLNWIGYGKASNYDLTITSGTLTVLPAEVSQDGEEPWGGDEPRPYVGGEGVASLYSTVNTYDGRGHTIDIETLSKIKLVGGDAPQISYSLTSNGVYQTEPICFTNVCCTSIWYKVESANHKPYIHEAGIDISARQVEITSGSAEKKYDGTPLVCHECVIGGDGFVEGEGVVIEYTGSQTLLGTSDNTFDYTFAEGTLADNYAIDKINGSLTVTYAGKFDEVPQVIEQEFSGGSATVHFAPVGEGVTIHYTTDGSVPTSASATYDGEIVVTDTTRIRAIASKYGWTDSDEMDVTVHCTSGIVDGEYASVAERYPNSYATITNVTVCGKAKLTAEFFAGCTALRTVTLGEDLQSIDCDAFDALPNFEWEIVDGYKYCSNWLFGYTDDAVESLTHTDTLKGVANGALEGCTAIHYFTCEVGSELKHIGSAAFKECVKLERVLLPEGVADIGDEAFYGCTKMANFIIPGTVKTIGASAFKRCTSLTGALFGYGIESVGDEAFYDDWRIAEVDIPSTVTNIGNNAFGGDSSIIRAGLRCDIGKKISDIFSHYANIREITVKEGDGEIPDKCFEDCGELDAVRYLGNCPVLENAGTNLYCTGTNTWLVSYVTQGSTGWDGVKASEALPQAWPLVGNCRRAIAFWDLPTYLCQFDSNGGTLGVQDTYQYSEKNVALPPEPVQSGYKFAGWWTQPVGGLRVTSDTIFIEGVYTYLYAHWIKGHWVFLDPNGGEVVNDFITYVEESTYGVLPMPVRSGYAFGGWLYDGRVIEPETEINEKADHTLVAQWTANLYSVRYNPNGGVGDEEMQGYVYGVEQALRKNTYTRSGYTFVGWSTNTTDEVVYRDCETVSNLTAVADGFVELYAVWEEGAIVDPTNVSFTFGGDEDWTKCYEGVVVTNAGEELRYDTIWKSGAITHNQSSVLKATVYGPGTISFWWKASCEAFRQYKLDYLEFAIDGVPCEPWINGETEWVYVEFDVDQSGEHVLTWMYAKDKEGTVGEDCGRVCAVVWTPRLETLADYLNSTNLTFTTSGDVFWTGDVATNHDGVASLKSGAIGDGGQSVVETTVDGPGKVSFWWKVSSETFRDYQVDYIACYVDGSEKAWMGGEIDWTNVCIAVEGDGNHTVRWIYQKDTYADSHDGDDCAWLDEVVWESTVKDDPIPDIGENATQKQVAEALSGSVDGKLAECITNAANYKAYREWAANVKTPDGGSKAGAQAVKESDNAWFSFAVGSDKLIDELPTSEDIRVDEFIPSSESGRFDFTVSVEGVTVSGEALKENLKQVFGIEGSTSLDSNGFSPNNVDLSFGTPENGKVKFTAKPMDDKADSFFMRVKVLP